MLPLLFTASILSACCLTESSCLSHDDLRELKTQFAISLYQHVARAENRSSLVLSPASVAASLELLQLGAQGNTFAELRDALGYSIHDGSTQDLVSAGPSGGGGGKARPACALFVGAAVELSPLFAARAARWARGSLQQADFSDAGAAAARTAASPLNQIAVVSTMYFKSTWQKKFSFMDTQMLPFTTAEGSTLKVPTMHHTAEVNYGQFQTASLEALSVLELPYVGEEISLLVLLPSHGGTSLARLESHLSASALALWAGSLKRMRMDVFLPRFSIQSNFDLKMAFSALGITDIFDPIKADFRGISEQGSLYVSEAVHKAKIEVAEDGTKASGATAVVLLKRSRTPVFKADRPFTFVLRQANTGMQASPPAAAPFCWNPSQVLPK
uniref:Serpin family E member 3 n=1 Tax=Nothoprocta perdicaria TaxID=30464 RepID=A0A8C6Z486_NOTPE